MKLPEGYEQEHTYHKFTNVVMFITVLIITIAFESSLVIRYGWDIRLLWFFPIVMFLAFWKAQTRSTPKKEERFLIKRDFPL